MPLKLSPAGGLQVYVWSWRNYPPYDEITRFDGKPLYLFIFNSVLQQYNDLHWKIKVSEL
jgi:hypothetical protein